MIIDWLTGLVALVALVLSQLPPLRRLFKKKELTLAAADTVGVLHFFGNTQLDVWIVLENSGGKQIKIDRIDCVLTRNNKEVQRLVANSYWLTESLGQDRAIQLPLAEIALKPEDRWSGYLRAWDRDRWSKPIQREVNHLSTAMREQISRKLESGEQKPVEIDDDLMEQLRDVTKRLAVLEEGDYTLTIRVFERSSTQPLQTTTFDFTMFENDVASLYADLETDYRMGFGPLWPSVSKMPVQLNLRNPRP